MNLVVMRTRFERGKPMLLTWTCITCLKTANKPIQSHPHSSQTDGRVVLGVFSTEAELLLHECPDEKCPCGDQHQEQDDGQRDGAAGDSRAVFPGNHVLDANVVNCEKGIVHRREAVCDEMRSNAEREAFLRRAPQQWRGGHRTQWQSK